MKELFNQNHNENRRYKLRTATILLVGMFVLSLFAGAVTATIQTADAPDGVNYPNAVYIPDKGTLLGVSYNPA